MKKIISIISGCLLTLAAVAADSSSSPVFQMRLVAEKTATDAEPLTYVMKSHGEERKLVMYVRKTVLLDQTDLKSVTVSTNTPSGAPQIDLAFTDQGAKRLADISAQNIGRHLAIVIDGRIYSAPVIRGPITGGAAQIDSSFTPQEAKDLAAIISKSLQK